MQVEELEVNPPGTSTEQDDIPIKDPVPITKRPLRLSSTISTPPILTETKNVRKSVSFMTEIESNAANTNNLNNSQEKRIARSEGILGHHSSRNLLNKPSLETRAGTQRALVRAESELMDPYDPRLHQSFEEELSARQLQRLQQQHQQRQLSKSDSKRQISQLVKSDSKIFSVTLQHEWPLEDLLHLQITSKTFIKFAVMCLFPLCLGVALLALFSTSKLSSHNPKDHIAHFVYIFFAMYCGYNSMILYVQYLIKHEYSVLKLQVTAFTACAISTIIYGILCWVRGVPNWLEITIPINVFIIPIGFVSFFGISFYTGGEWRNRAFLRDYMFASGVAMMYFVSYCFLIGYSWVFHRVSQELQMLLGFLFPVFEYLFKALTKRTVARFESAAAVTFHFWYSHLFTLYFIAGIVNEVSRTDVYVVLILSKAAFLCYYNVLATDYYYERHQSHSNFSLVNTSPVGREQQRSRYYDTLLLDFQLCLVNELLATIYVCPLWAVWLYDSPLQRSLVVQGWLTPVFYLISFVVVGSFTYLYIYFQARQKQRKYNTISPSPSTANLYSSEEPNAIPEPQPPPPKLSLLRRHHRIFLPFVVIETYFPVVVASLTGSTLLAFLVYNPE